MQSILSAFVMRLGVGLGLGLAGPMAVLGQSVCTDLGCMGLNSLSSHGLPQEAQSPHIAFDLQVSDPESEAFRDQLVGLVGRNLDGFASISSSTSPQQDSVLMGEALEPESKSADRLLSVESSDFAPSLASNAQLSMSDFQVLGQVQYQNSEVVELNLIIERRQEESVSIQNLILRADANDWRSVAHYVSDTLFTLMTDEPGLFHSHIAFIANLPDEQGFKHQLAMVDQAGGNLRLISEAGNKAAHPTYLANQFELTFLDLSGEVDTLVHYNLLTGRLTPLLLLPDLQGAPALGPYGRFIAFSGLEDDEKLELQEESPTDIFVVDVHAAALQAINIPGSHDREPAFAPNLEALAFISSRESWNEIVTTRLPNREDLDEASENPLMGIETQMRSLYGTPNPLFRLAWSPDGQTLAFIERMPEEDQLLLLDVESGLVEVLATGSKLTDIAWGPDAHLMALVVDSPAAGPGTLLRLNLQQGVAEILSVPYPVSSPSWSSSLTP